MRKYFAFITIFVILIGSLNIPTVFASTADDLNNQITSVNSQIAELDKEIAKYQDQIAQTSEQKNTLANLIKQLNLTRSKLITEKNQTQKKITATNLVIQSISNNIDAQQKSINDSENSLAKMIRDLYQMDQTLLVEKILSQTSFQSASEEYNNILSLNEQVRTHISDVKSQKEILQTSKTKKETEKNTLTTLKNSLVQKQTAIEVTQKEKNTLLTETKNKEANYQKLLAENQKKRDAFEQELSKYEDQLKFTLNPNLLPAEGSDVLAWPLDKVFITQLFGVTSASKRLYKSGSHSGVDFRASVGMSVKAMATGTVLGTGDTDIYCKGASFGKWVFIKYNNGLSSAFGHLSSISAVSGQKVEAGDVVAFSGNTGHTTGPHLHVTVYASGGVKVDSVPSITCNGKSFIMPIAASSSYLDPLL